MIVIIDSGGANIASIKFALERCGAKACLSANSAEIESADKVILPGVGMAATAMTRLRRHAVDHARRAHLENLVLRLAMLCASLLFRGLLQQQQH